MWRNVAAVPLLFVLPTPSDLKVSSAEMQLISAIMPRFAPVTRLNAVKICWFREALFAVRLWDPVMSVRFAAASVRLARRICSKPLRPSAELPRTFVMLPKYAPDSVEAVPPTRICHQERFAELRMGSAMRRKCARAKARPVHPMQSLCRPRFAAPAPVNVTLPNDVPG